MRHTSVIFVGSLLLGAGVAPVAGCRDDVAASNVDLDGGLAFADGSSTPPDTTDAATPPDAGADATVVGPVTCGASTQVDTAGNNVADIRAVTIAPGRFAVSWTETGPQGGGLIALKVRVSTNGVFAAEQQLAGTVRGSSLLAADGQGRAYAMWTPDLGVFALTTLAPNENTFGASTSASGVIQTGEIAGLSTGGALLGCINNPQSPAITKYDPASGTWVSEVVVPPDTFTAQISSLATSHSGKSALGWLAKTDDPMVSLRVSTSGDGASWTPSTTSLPTITGEANMQTQALQSGVYANGDVLFVFITATGATTNILSSRYHVATKQFDAALPIEVTTESLNISTMRVFVDASDRATVLFVKNGELFSSRDVGAGWTAPLDLGAANNVVAAMDANGNLATVLQPSNQSGVSTLRRLGAAAATWTDPVATGFTATQGSPFFGIVIVFDAAGSPIVLARQPPMTSGLTPLKMVVCQ